MDSPTPIESAIARAQSGSETHAPDTTPYAGLTWVVLLVGLLLVIGGFIAFFAGADGGLVCLAIGGVSIGMALRAFRRERRRRKIETRERTMDQTFR